MPLPPARHEPSPRDRHPCCRLQRIAHDPEDSQLYRSHLFSSIKLPAVSGRSITSHTIDTLLYILLGAFILLAWAYMEWRDRIPRNWTKQLYYYFSTDGREDRIASRNRIRLSNRWRGAMDSSLLLIVATSAARGCNNTRDVEHKIIPFMTKTSLSLSYLKHRRLPATNIATCDTCGCGEARFPTRWVHVLWFLPITTVWAQGQVACHTHAVTHAEMSSRWVRVPKVVWAGG